MLQLLFLVNSILWEVGIHYGGAVLGANVLMTLACGFVLVMSRKRMTSLSLGSFLMFLLLVVYALPITLIGPCQGELFRAFVSAVLFFLFFLVAFELGRSATASDWLKIENAACAVLVIGIASVFLELLVPQLFPSSAGYRSLGKYSGMFIEPSKLVMSMSPSLMILLRSVSRQKHRLGLLALFLLYGFSKAATLVGIFGLYAIYSILLIWPWQVYAKLIFAVLSVGLVLAVVSYKSFVEPSVSRVVGLFHVQQTAEISSLIYLAGMQDGKANFARTYGLGTGFNTMGCDPLPKNLVRELLAESDAISENSDMANFNTRDGSFLLAKLLSEFGVMGLVLLGVVWRKLRTLDTRTGMTKDQQVAISVITSLLLTFLASAIVRSTGYFQGTIFFGILAVGGCTSSLLRGPIKASALHRGTERLPT